MKFSPPPSPGQGNMAANDPCAFNLHFKRIMFPLNKSRSELPPLFRTNEVSWQYKNWLVSEFVGMTSYVFPHRKKKIHRRSSRLQMVNAGLAIGQLCWPLDMIKKKKKSELCLDSKIHHLGIYTFSFVTDQAKSYFNTICQKSACPETASEIKPLSTLADCESCAHGSQGSYRSLVSVRSLPSALSASLSLSPMVRG